MSEARVAPISGLNDADPALDLERALRALGFRCTVEAIDRLAVIVADDESAEREIAERRRGALQAIGAHGFTHLALEVQAEPAERATLHRD